MKSLILVVALLFSQMGFAAGQCFSVREVTGWDAINSHRLEIFGAGRRVYRVELWGQCFDLQFADRLGFRTWPRGSSWVCEGDEIIPINFGRYGNPCPIDQIQRVR